MNREVIRPASPETRARLKALADRPLSLEEWRARAAVPATAGEIADARALIEWFCRRYPTPGARLAYARRAYARWTRAMVMGRPPPESAR